MDADRIASSGNLPENTARFDEEAQMSQSNKSHILTPAEANDFIAEKDPVILDVRTPGEYREGHIAGAVNLPLNAIDDTTAMEAIGSYGKPVLVYCTIGHRSAMAAQMLVDLGFTNVYDLANGISAWPFGVVS